MSSMFEDELFFADEDEVEEKCTAASSTEPWNLLIVDDEPEMHSVTKMVLSGVEFEGRPLSFLSAYSAREAKEILGKQEGIAVILLDVVMEKEDSGLSLVQYIRNELLDYTVRIILRTGQPGQAPEQMVIAEYDINDYKDKSELTSQKLYTSIITALRSYRDIMLIKGLSEKIYQTQKELIYTLGEITETRSKETGYHVKRVAEYSSLLASLLGLPEEEVELIRLASPMHDVGKVAIPDAILNKPGKYTPEEYNAMKKHAQIGHEMLKNAKGDLFQAAATIALQHHEKFDGTGYPLGLRGEDIHLYARISAIADVFDALGSDRVYKAAWPLEDIIELFQNERGKHFDPLMIDIFMKNLDKFLEIKNRYDDLAIEEDTFAV